MCLIGNSDFILQMKFLTKKGLKFLNRVSFLRREIISIKWLKINSAMTHDLSLFIKSEHIIKYKYI